MPSSPQTVATAVAFDYLIGTNGKPIVGAIVNCVLNYNQSTVASPAVSIADSQQQTTTDQNGYFQFTLVPNANISPTGTTYTITTPFSAYDITVGTAGPYQTTAVGTIVNVPGSLSPALTNLTGPITVTGNETVTGNLVVNGTTTLAGTNTGALAVTGNETVSGTEVVTGDLTANARLIFGAASAKILGGSSQLSIRDHADTTDVLVIFGGTTVKVASGDLQISGGNLVLFNAASQIIPGGTSMALRNNANSANNLFLTDAGAATLRNSLSIPPSAGGIVAPTSYGSVPIKFDEQTPTSGTSITIPAAGSIPGTFRTVRVRFQVNSGVAANADTMNMRFNGDTANHYSYEIMQGSSSTVSSAQTLSAGAFAAFEVVGASTGATIPAGGWIEIFNYASTVFRKTFVAQWYTNNGGTLKVWQASGDWSTTNAAIASVTFFLSTGPYVSGTVFTTELSP